MPIAALARSILDGHHALLKRELPRLEERLRSADPAIALPWKALQEQLLSHMEREESVLFPGIFKVAAGECPEDRRFCDALVAEGRDHNQMLSLIDGLRSALELAGDAEEELAALLDDLVLHLFVEEHRLFPEVRRRLDAMEESRDEQMALRRAWAGARYRFCCAEEGLDDRERGEKSEKPSRE